MNYEQLASDIAAWMRDYAERAGLQGYTLGVSGGIDSAVVAALAARAVGPEHVLGVVMPCHSQAEDIDLAAALIATLGISSETVDLTATYDTLVAALPGGSPMAGTSMARARMAHANIKPRLRMTTLYFLAQTRALLVAGTGNKPEMMVGYFTKYGDGGVDIEPLGQLYKHEVRELAKVLGVPAPIITRPPSAGLWPGQTDEGELGITYDTLDAILDALERGSPPPAPETQVAQVQRMITTSAHKRAMPPSYPVDRTRLEGASTEADSRKNAQE
ncbi:MAG: NAD+ synthase [Anaerolineae bacterium]